MSTVRAGVGARSAPQARRRRAAIVTSLVSLVAILMLGDLLLIGHTKGEEIWGPVTAAMATIAGTMSLAFLAIHSRSRAARLGLYALWLTVAFFGFGGYQSHGLPAPVGTVDPRPRPPVAPLVFTGLGIAGALSLRYGTKED